MLTLALSRFTRAALRHKHKRKYKTKERFTLLVLAFMLSLKLASPLFARWFSGLMLGLMVMVIRVNQS